MGGNPHNMIMTQIEFEQLPKQEQNFRWALFLKSNGYERELTAQEFEEIRNIFSKYKVIITQRYHGIILAEMFGIPYVAIHHHDKLKNCQPANGQFISYYNFNKSALNNAINSLVNFSKNNIDINAFSEIIIEVKSYT